MSSESSARFVQLLDELHSQHEREVQELQRANETQKKLAEQQVEETARLQLQIEQLNEEIGRLRKDTVKEVKDGVQETCDSPAVVNLSIGAEDGTFDVKDELRQEASCEDPHTILDFDLPRQSEVSRGSRGRPSSLADVADFASEADGSKRGDEQADASEDHVLNVRAILHRVVLPAAGLEGCPAAPKLSISVSCGEMQGLATSVTLLQESLTLPGETGEEMAWQADWGEDGADVLLLVPKSMVQDEIIAKLEVDELGTVASTVITLNGGRSNWVLDGGGFLDGQVVMEKVETPASRRRASTTTRARILERLEKLFEVKGGSAKVIMALDLANAMHNSQNGKFTSNKQKRHSAKFDSQLSPEDLEEAVVELKRIHRNEVAKSQGRAKASTQPVLAWKEFIECMLLPDLPKHAYGAAALNLFIIQRELLGDEMPTSGTSQALLLAYEKTRKPVSQSQRWVSIVTALSTGAIILSFAFMGISLDTDPEWPGWLVLDSLFAIIFVLEVVVKSYVLTPHGYFCGRDSMWNFFDVTLSFVAVVEVILQVMFAAGGGQARAALVLRGLRLARMARLAKLIRMPLLEELANLISGFVLSVRSLFWVMIFLFLIIYVIALGFRAGVQTVTDSTMADCEGRLGDNVELDEVTNLPPRCKLHYMYGVEFCGSIFGCMFSIFRCMISECTSKSGRSLTMIFSDGFGMQFDMFYAASMVVVLFGLFNIITAIFVEATLNGLKENEVQRRYAKAYESSYMTEQLAKLVMTVGSQVQKLRNRSTLNGLFSDLQMGLNVGSVTEQQPSNQQLKGEIYLSEEEFNQLVRQPDVRQILNDLDVNVEPRPGIFEAFNTENDGKVSLSELVSGLMRLRGDLHKVDLVIAQMSLDNMQKQLADLKKSSSGSPQSDKKKGLKREKSASKPRVTAVSPKAEPDLPEAEKAA